MAPQDTQVLRQPGAACLRRRRASRPPPPPRAAPRSTAAAPRRAPATSAATLDTAAPPGPGAATLPAAAAPASRRAPPPRHPRRRSAARTPPLPPTRPPASPPPSHTPAARRTTASLSACTTSCDATSRRLHSSTAPRAALTTGTENASWVVVCFCGEPCPGAKVDAQKGTERRSLRKPHLLPSRRDGVGQWPASLCQGARQRRPPPHLAVAGGAPGGGAHTRASLSTRRVDTQVAKPFYAAHGAHFFSKHRKKHGATSQRRGKLAPQARNENWQRQACINLAESSLHEQVA
jgi:hypothetical protein